MHIPNVLHSVCPYAHFGVPLCTLNSEDHLKRDNLEPYDIVHGNQSHA